MKKILYSGRAINSHIGGNTTYARKILLGMETEGFDCSVLPSVQSPVANLLVENGPLARSNTTDLVHFTNDTGPLFAFKKPVITTVHGMASLHVETGRSRLSEAIWRARVSAAIKFSNIVVTVSQTSAQDLQNHFGLDGSKIRIIPHGIDYEFYSDEANPAALPEGFPARFMLYLGNIEHRKNVMSLVGAMNLLRESGVSLPLVIAGRPAWNSDEIMKLIRASPNVIYLGFVSEEVKRTLLQTTDLFLFPSRYEGFGFPVLEALAAGARVVSSFQGALQEVSGPSAQFTGLDPLGIATTISRELQTEENSNKRSERRLFAKGFSWATSVAKHRDVYEELL